MDDVAAADLLGRTMFARRRFLTLLAAAPAFPALAKSPAPAAPTRDLSGLWTNASYTHLQRPKAFKGLIATPAEAEAYESPRRRLHGELSDPERDVLGQNESEFPDNGPGLARIKGEIRTSWITDPPDGRIPWSDDGKKRVDAYAGPDLYENVEQRDTDERCLTSSSATAPLINTHDANVMQFVQTPDAVVIVGEKIHQARIIRLGDPASPPDPREAGIPSWNGVSVGRWEGATLMAVTTRLRPGLTRLDDDVFLSERSRVVERFTRTGPSEIAYAFEVTDDSLFTRTWRGEATFRPATAIYEYACHEGNYALPSILSAARQADAAAAKGKWARGFRVIAAFRASIPALGA